MKKNHWWDRSSIKPVLLALFPIVIGIVVSLAMADYKSDRISIIWWGADVCLMIFYIILVGYYAKQDVNLKTVNQYLETEIMARNNFIATVIELHEKTAENLNIVAHSIAQKNVFDMANWSFDKEAMNACWAIYTVLSEISSGISFEVTYVKCIHKDKKGERIQMVGYYNESHNHPTIFMKARKLDDPNAYYDTKLFKRNNSDIDILLTKEEIADNFVFKNRKQQKDKYSQYIGVPVYCNSIKMVGLIQIAFYNSSVLSDNPNRIKEIVQKYIKPIEAMLVSHTKMEKVLLALPSISVEEVLVS